jgi:SOS-response transcriptional repressor LexA
MTETSIGTGISFISAGFPSPAEDFTELSISLDKHLIQNAAANFMAYANGNAMTQPSLLDKTTTGLLRIRGLNTRSQET